MRRTYRPGLFGRKHLVERALGVRVEIVADQNHRGTLRVAAFQQPGHFQCPVDLGFRWPSRRLAANRGSGSVNMKMLAVPAPLIFVVDALGDDASVAGIG